MIVRKDLSFLLVFKCACLVIPAMVAAADGTADPPVAQVATGVLRGQHEGSVDNFSGVPYARAPIGSLRWRPPQPALPWTGVRSAQKFGPACLQPSDNGKPNPGGYAGPSSEDCLTLNVWAPRGARGAPVMVFVHGGANRFSAGSFPFWNGTAFARDGVVLVTFNYRLGGMGYFAHPALTREAGPREPLGNYALLDQIAALRWVQRNIRAFGGDPQNVTLFGESSGANQTLWLLTVASARGLFKRAIVESAGGWVTPATLAQQEQEGVETAKVAGLSGAEATAAALRRLPASAFLDPAFKKTDFQPLIDGRLVTETPTQAFARNHVPALPLVIGFNSFEGSVMRPDSIALMGDLPRKLASLYPPSGPGDLSMRMLWGDQYAGAPSRWIAARNASKAPTWLYRFSYLPETQRKLFPGAPHGSELTFVFDSWDEIQASGTYRLLTGADMQVTAQDRAMTAILHGCWVAFAKGGRPDCPGAPSWPRYSHSADQLMDFDLKPSVRSGFQKDQFDALEHWLLPGYLQVSNP
ncbi:MAG TPA: carboxylesterase family protein [Steroidobacteraceae bacterium]|nr:carboxylesterase family protein [Steroidobacteraceae bacterium]